MYACNCYDSWFENSQQKIKQQIRFDSSVCVETIYRQPSNLPSKKQQFHLLLTHQKYASVHSSFFSFSFFFLVIATLQILIWICACFVRFPKISFFFIFHSCLVSLYDNEYYSCIVFFFCFRPWNNSRAINLTFLALVCLPPFCLTRIAGLDASVFFFFGKNLCSHGVCLFLVVDWFRYSVLFCYSLLKTVMVNSARRIFRLCVVWLTSFYYYPYTCTHLLPSLGRPAKIYLLSKLYLYMV